MSQFQYFIFWNNFLVQYREEKSFESQSALASLLGEKLLSGEGVRRVTPVLPVHLTLTEMMMNMMAIMTMMVSKVSIG